MCRSIVKRWVAFAVGGVLLPLGMYQLTYGCPPGRVAGKPPKHESLTVFFASSLRGVMKDLTAEFEQTYHHMPVRAEAGGSRELAYMISNLQRKADLIFVADPLVIKDLLMPDHADWYIAFGANPLVIAYTERSKYGEEITKDNWYTILARKDVRLGRANEHLAPLGYRTLMAWQLADGYYQGRAGMSIPQALSANCPAAHILPSEMELLQPLQSYDLDYVFEYRNVAKSQHLKYLELPDEINLGNPDFAERYARAKVDISGKQRGATTTVTGTPITYGFAFLKDPAHQCDIQLTQAGSDRPLASQCLNHDCDLAGKQWVCILDFVKPLFSEEGRKMLEANGFAYSPPVASDPSRLPLELRALCEHAPRQQPAPTVSQAPPVQSHPEG